MIQSSPSIISLLICLGLEVLFGIVYFIYWFKYRSDKVHLNLSLWFVFASLYTLCRITQFFTTNISCIPFYAKTSAVSHYILIYLGWNFVNAYVKFKPGQKEKFIWHALIITPILFILFSEIYISNTVVLRETIFNEAFHSLKQGDFYLYFATLRPLMLLFLTLRLLYSPNPAFKERIYLIIGFSATVLFSISDAISIFFNLKFLRMYDFAFVPLGLMFTMILIERYYSLYSEMELLVEKRTTQISEAISTLKNEIETRIQAEKELNEYKTNLEKLVEKRTEELNNAAQKYLTLNEELHSTNEILEDQRNQLEKALHNLELAKDQIVQSEKMAALGVLTAGIAHEINNPLNFIVGATANLNAPIKNVKEHLASFREISESTSKNVSITNDLSEIDELLSFIQTGSTRISEIVGSLRSFTWTDNGNMVELDIRESINSALVMLQFQLKGRIKIIKNYKEIPKYKCFEGKLNQVFINIFSNAIQAIEKSGEIMVSTDFDKRTSSVNIVIKDTGVGIPKEIQNKIFEPFYTTKQIGKGTGLGLSIVYGIIEQLNGRIHVNSEVGKGTEFTIILPLN